MRRPGSADDGPAEATRSGRGKLPDCRGRVLLMCRPGPVNGAWRPLAASYQRHCRQYFSSSTSKRMGWKHISAIAKTASSQSPPRCRAGRGGEPVLGSTSSAPVAGIYRGHRAGSRGVLTVKVAAAAHRAATGSRRRKLSQMTGKGMCGESSRRVITSRAKAALVNGRVASPPKAARRPPAGQRSRTLPASPD